jgi:hypothetical protein
MGILDEDFFTFMTISRWILYRMRNVLEKYCRDNQNTHFMFSKLFCENRALHEIMSKNVVEPERPRGCTRFRARAYARTRVHSHSDM